MDNLRLQLDGGDEIVLLYVKHFKWLEKSQEALFNGHPESGRIYRALKTKSPAAYYIDISPNPDNKDPMLSNLGGIRITELTNADYLWDYSFEELTDDNITDFDIEKEDYSKLASWVSTNHEEFVQKLTKGSNLIASETDEIPEIEPMNEIQLPEETQKILSKINDMIGKNVITSQKSIARDIAYLSFRDPGLLEALSMFTAQLTKALKQEDNSDVMSMSQEISMSETLGKGANIYGATLNLDNYLSNENVSLEQKQLSLTRCLSHILFELNRISQYGQR